MLTLPTFTEPMDMDWMDMLDILAMLDTVDSPPTLLIPMATLRTVVMDILMLMERGLLMLSPRLRLRLLSLMDHMDMLDLVDMLD